MTDAVPLIYRHGRILALTEPTTAIVWSGESALFAMGDGNIRIVTGDAPIGVAAAHGGAVLCATRHPDGKRIVTGGDDGRVVVSGVDGTISEIGSLGGRWIDHLVASAASGLIVASCGREAIVWKPDATTASHLFDFPSTVGGLALDGKGKRLAVAHYGGAALLFPATAGSGRVALKWGGSHISATLRPDGDYLVTGTQETGLHGWRLPLGTDMAMSGYRAKTRSFSWNRRAKWLATSGDAKVVIWPFDGKTGPMGRAPLLVGDRRVVVTRVAFHPKDDLLAVGYADGAVALVRISDDSVLPVDEAGGGAITALAWNDAGTRLGFGDDAGRGGILDVTART